MNLFDSEIWNQTHSFAYEKCLCMLRKTAIIIRTLKIAGVDFVFFKHEYFHLQIITLRIHVLN